MSTVTDYRPDRCNRGGSGLRATMDSFTVRLSEADQNKAERALGFALLVLGGELLSSPTHHTGVNTVVQLRRRLTRKQTESIAAQYRAGKSTYELAAEWQINRATVTMALK